MELRRPMVPIRSPAAPRSGSARCSSATARFFCWQAARRRTRSRPCGKLAPPYGAIFCQRAHAHVMDDECGAPEFFSAGAKLIGISGDAGKITPAALAASNGRLIRLVWSSQVRPAACRCPQLSAIEGTLLSRTKDGSRFWPPLPAGRRAACACTMDGARFANAVASLGCPRQPIPRRRCWRRCLVAWCLKNAGVACEAVVFFDKALAADFA